MESYSLFPISVFLPLLPVFLIGLNGGLERGTVASVHPRPHFFLFEFLFLAPPTFHCYSHIGI